MASHSQFFSLGGPELARPPPRNIKPSRRSDLCLQLGDDDYIGNNSANLLVFHPCATRPADQERFYANVGLEGPVRMINTTSGATHVLSSNPYLAGAFVVTSSRDDWSNFLVEVGQGQFADLVRFRNAVSNQCLNFNDDTNPTFSDCNEPSFDQFFSFDVPETPRPPPRTIRPYIASQLCLQLRNDESVGNNVASLLTFYPCGTGKPDQEQFYLSIGVAGHIEMLNTTTSAKYSLSTNPHFIGAYVIDNPPDEWSDFTLDEGTGVFADQVRIRNAFNDHLFYVGYSASIHAIEKSTAVERGSFASTALE
ncbi:hypothetical protein QFC20_007464 [Naganishia adeliensis]|uniref:Uncharacterized protein n=1 Tax=Naganishia adeliensis TaxID=92952 RepID=A0ACC2UZ98_9TREE|nr:hypothetical protein QFC20_007464 [Naganishia adeliensis]